MFSRESFINDYMEKYWNLYSDILEKVKIKISED